MRRLFVALAITLAGLAPRAEAASPAVEITEARNAAAGFAVTSSLFQMDTLGNHCIGLPPPTSSRAQVALSKWHQRNGALADAAMEYIVLSGEYIAASGGDDAKVRFHEERKREFLDSARDAQRALFATGAVDARGCESLVDAVVDGVMDLDRNAELYPILVQMKSDLDAWKKRHE